MTAKPKAKAWKAFLPIDTNKLSWCLACDDLAFLQQYQIGPALAVLRHVREELLLLVRALGKGGRLAGFHFLIHNRESGVPCPPKDSRSFIDLSLWFKKSRDLLDYAHDCSVSLDNWCFISPRVSNQNLGAHVPLLNRQSAWLLDFIESCEGQTDMELLKHLGQQYHYFANMAQMVIR